MDGGKGLVPRRPGLMDAWLKVPDAPGGIRSGRSPVWYTSGMRTIALLAVSAAAMGLAAAQKQAGGRASALRDWENPAVNSYNRMPAATYAMPLADAKAALAGALEFETPWKMSLNGTWRFRVRQTGLGGASVGPAPLARYRFDPSEPVSWTLSIRGIRR